MPAGGSTEEDISADEMMNIMIATDVHLGYCEKDNIRGEDSFIAFEEILELAVQRDVDFILLAGDLFHDANPSQNSLHRCLKLLRTFTLGDKPIKLEFLSDQSLNFFDSLSQTVNYEDPNMNISIPVFSIHGNHDDPSGFGRISSLDLLSTTGLINYFGKWVDLTKVVINPIMMKKAETQLALYGLSHIHDVRLCRLFRDSKVVMDKPDEKTGEWFNIMVLHQNRADRGPKNFLPEEILPSFLDLVIWGHEHDCRIIPEENDKQNFFVVQPGSSVATSLSEGESLPKHCGILHIHKRQFKLEPIPLKTVRPFIFDTIDIIDYMEEHALDEGDIANKVMELAKEHIEGMITKANEKLSGDERQPKLPLIRLRIQYTEEEQMFNHIRFGQQFNERVANPMDMILFKRMTRKTRYDINPLDKSVFDDAFKDENKGDETRVEDIVDKYFENVDESKQLQLLSSKALSEMCRRLVDSNDDDAADRILKFYENKAKDYFMEKMPDEEDFEEELARFRDKSQSNYDDMLKMLDNRGGTKKPATKDVFTVPSADESDGDNEPLRPVTSTSRATKKTNESTTRGTGRGRGRGRGSRGGRGGAAVKNELNISKSAAAKQTTLAQSFSQSAGRSRIKSKQITYEISDSD